MTAQDKILHVANKLGLSSLQNMQGSTGAVYDVDADFSGQIFSNAARHTNPSETNINENQFEVNEALLIETIGFYIKQGEADAVFNLQRILGSGAVVVFDLVIGNKRVMKDTPVFAAGSPYTFANTANVQSTAGGVSLQILLPRHQIFMEGAGILIPPQVQYSINYTIFDVVTGAVLSPVQLGAYLFGTRVLLNFNTSI